MATAATAPLARRPAAPPRAPASATPRAAAPPLAGVPNFLTLTGRRSGSAASSVASRIDASRQSQQAHSRAEAEQLADQLGQPELREVMRPDETQPTPSQPAGEAAATQPGMQHAGTGGARTGEDRAASAADRSDAGPALLEPEAETSPGDGGDAAAAAGTAGAAGGAGGAGADEGTGSGGTDAAGTAGAATRAAGAGAADGSAGAAAPGRGAGAAGSSGPLSAEPADSGPVTPVSETGAGALETGDLVLIDLELAEHQRWAGALGRVGEVASIQRAEFIAESVGSGFISGVASGGVMGLGIGLVTRAVPAIGPIIGGGLALHGLVTRDWAATGATIGRFGEGNSSYETLANSIASVSAVIDVVSQVLSVINGIVGIVEGVAIGVAAGAGVLAFFTFGATAGIAIAAGELAVTCEEIRQGINIVTAVLDTVNAALLSPCVTLFRALHAFTTEADPREVEASGGEISSAAAQSGAALGAWAGGRASQAGGRPRPPVDDGAPTTPRPPHESPRPAAGDGPEVRFEPAPAGRTAPAQAAPEPSMRPDVAEIAASPGQRISDDQGAAAPSTPASTGPAPSSAEAVGPAPASRPAEQLTLPGVDMTPQPRPAEAALPPPDMRPHPVTPDIEIRGDYSDPALSVQPNRPGGAAAAGDIAPHRLQGERGSALISEHVIPGAQMRDVSIDPAHGAPDWQRTAPGGESDGRDYSNATTIAEHAPVSARKTTLDNAETRALQAAGGPRNPVDDLLLPSLQRHQQAVDDAIAAGEITPAQATDPTHRALAAMAEMSSLSESSGGAQARAEAQARGTRVPNPRRADRRRAAEGERVRNRLDGEVIEPIDWEGTFPNPNRSAPPGTQLALPGMEHLATPPAARAPEQLTLPGFDRPAPNPNQLTLPFDAPSAPRTSPDQPLRVSEGLTRSGEPLRPGEFEQHAEMAVSMGMPRDQIHPAQGDTSYHPGYDALLIGRDINPLPAAERPTGLANPANAALEPRAVIGHEVIGHREAALGGQTRDEVWHEELQASARAALHTPGLSPEQSWLLLQDAAARRRFQTREGEIFIDTERYGPAAPQRATPADAAAGQPGREASVVVDWDALGVAPPAAAGRSSSAPARASADAAPVSPAAAARAVTAPTSTAATAPAITGNWATAARAGRSAAVEAAAGGPQAGAGPGAPSWGTRAQQVGALFLPQVFGAGGTAPTYAQQRAAHRARFTDDNQPAEGVERVNPHYTPPPATPAQIVAVQNEILNLLTVRARAEAEAQHQDERAGDCDANRAPVARTMADTRAGLSAVAAHEAAVARRDAANQEQQQRQQEAAGLVAGYPSRATGLAALTVPLAAWEGFTDIASELPGSAGDRMAEMNHEAQQMQAAFGEMGAHMLGIDTEQPARQGELASDAGRLDATADQAQTSDQRLQGADEGAAGLHEANEATLAEAAQRRDAATQRSTTLAEAAQERELHADELAAQLQGWAALHREERRSAVEAVEQRLQDDGNVITQRSTD